MVDGLRAEIMAAIFSHASLGGRSCIPCHYQLHILQHLEANSNDPGARSEDKLL